MRRRQTIPIEEHEACLRQLEEMLREARTAWCHEHEALIWEESGCDPYEEIRAVGGDAAVTDAIYHARWMNDEWDEQFERGVARLREIVAERDAALAEVARLRAVADCGQEGVCRITPGCNRHWEERNRELVEDLQEVQEALGAQINQQIEGRQAERARAEAAEAALAAARADHEQGAVISRRQWTAQCQRAEAAERDRDYLEARTHAALRWAGVRHLGGGLFQRADGARWLLRGCTDDPHEGCPIPPDPAFVPETVPTHEACTVPTPNSAEGDDA